MSLPANIEALGLDGIEALEQVFRQEKAKLDATAARVKLREWGDHPSALEFIESKALRKMAKAGRRGAKTTAAAMIAVNGLLANKRVVYGVPTVQQLDTFWREVKNALWQLVQDGFYIENKTEHTIGLPNSEIAIVGKTLWNADTARGTFGAIIILDEFQLMNESVWEDVVQPMLFDKNGQAVFIFTPPSLLEPGISKARDPAYASKMFKEHKDDSSGLWQTFHWTSHDNPNLDREGLALGVAGMAVDSYRREVLAEDDDLNPAQMIYRAFDTTTQIIPDFAVSETWPRYVGHDFGGANPAALFFAQDPATGYFYAYHEYFPGRGLSTYEHIQAFTLLAKGVTVLKRVGGSHQEDEIRQGYTAQGWPINEPKILNVNARIDRVRAVMEKNQLFVFESLRRLRQELTTYLWKIDADGRITDDIHNKSAFHMCDAMAYILSDFTPERVASIHRRPVRRDIARF